jgi:HAD superfamily hydrolase (TIGR01662 family)
MLFPDVAHTLSALRSAGLRLGLITNGSVSMQSRKLECLSLSSSFDTILISAAEGISKPDPEIFQRALERLEANAPESVFVGDHPEVDISGARSAGMRAIWRRDSTVSRVVETDATIDEVHDLLDMLGLGPSGRPNFASGAGEPLIAPALGLPPLNFKKPPTLESNSEPIRVAQRLMVAKLTR